MKLTGELLKNERLNKGFTVQDVAMSLKLSSKMINSIEAGNLNELPAKTFVRGFVKSYAQLLKLDAETVLRQFQEEMGSTIPLPKVPPPKTSDTSRDFKGAKPAPKQTAQNYSADKPKFQAAQIEKDYSKHIKILMIIAVVGIIIVSAINYFNKPKNEPLAINDTNIITNNNTAPADNSSSVDSAQNTTTKNADAATANQLLRTDDSAKLTHEIINNNSSSNITTTNAEVGFSKSKEEPVELIIESKKTGELEYSKSITSPFKSLTMEPNQIYVIRSKSGLYLKSKNVDAFKITVNGSEFALPKNTSKDSENSEVKLTF